MRVASLLLVFALAFPAEALANPREFKKLVNQAERLYEAGKYKQSAERLIEAYAYQPHPRLIYNIARAYDQAGELQLSLEYYQRYVKSQEGTDPTLLKRSALSIDRLNALIHKQQKSKAEDAEQQKKLEEEARAAKERAEQESEAKLRAEAQLRQQEKAAAESRTKARSRNRIISYVLGGVAVAGLGTGTFFGLGANASKERFTAAETIPSKQTFEQETRSKALLADVGFGVGIAAAITAIVLYPKGPDEPEKAVLVPAPGGAGVAVSF